MHVTVIHNVEKHVMYCGITTENDITLQGKKNKLK